MDKTKTPLRTVADLYVSTCRTEGKTEKTLSGYKENLTRFVAGNFHRHRFRHASAPEVAQRRAAKVVKD